MTTPNPGAAASGYPEGAVVRVEDMGPVERAFAEAEHERCEDGSPHPLAAHSPWSGGDLDGGEPWSAFMDRLARHGLSLTLFDQSHAWNHRGSPAYCMGCRITWSREEHERPCPWNRRMSSAAQDFASWPEWKKSPPTAPVR